MTQKELIELATTTFVKNVNAVKVVNVLESRRESLSPWVLDILNVKFEGYNRISSLIKSLFGRTRLEPGETIAYADTSMFFDGPDCDDPFGRVLEVAQCKGHVWIRFNFGDHPLSSFELSMYDNSKDD